MLSRYTDFVRLGQGGMGIVYRAVDTQLHRPVALKFVTAQFGNEEQARTRFLREARMAAALNHPAICTIHEIGAVQPGEERLVGPESSFPSGTPFIAMELIEGRALDALLREHGRFGPDELLDVAIPIAEALATAHAKSIVHRDLKPANVMMTPEGRPKILDFGLAKLVDAFGDEAVTTTETESADLTRRGQVLGTIAYMSPEQAQGKPVDLRSDIFSFGVMLYEVAAGERPFQGDTPTSTLAKILETEPRPLGELRSDLPGEMLRIVRRCLRKKPEERFQNTSDVVVALKELRQEKASGPARGWSDAVPVTHEPSAVTGALAPRRWAAAMISLVVMSLLVVAAIFVLAWRRPAPTQAAAVFSNMRMTPLVEGNDLRNVAISPDGKYLARVTEAQGGFSLLIRQVATGSDVLLLGPQKPRIGGLRFTPGGDYLFYYAYDPERTGYAALFRIPSLGGTPHRLLFDVDSRPAFSPDGKRLAIFRHDPIARETRLIIASSDGTGEKTLAVRRAPSGFINDASWSPDGLRIVAFAWTLGETSHRSGLVEFAVENGTEIPLGPNWWGSGYGLAWLPDGSGVLASVAHDEKDRYEQVWLIPYPSGTPRRITNDLFDYGALTITADGKSFAAVQSRFSLALWSLDATDHRSMRQLVRSTSADLPNLNSYRSAPDGTIFFAAQGRDGVDHLWSVRRDGSHLVQETPDDLIVFECAVARSSGSVFVGGIRRDVLHSDNPVHHVWRLGPGGADLVQLTSGDDEVLLDASPAGDEILLKKTRDRGVWRMRLSGGDAVKIHDCSVFTAQYSPDGERILVGCDQPGPSNQRVLEIHDRGTGRLVRTIPVDWFPSSGLSSARWSPSGRDLTYVWVEGGVANLWSLPLTGGTARRITNFTSEQIDAFVWSADGKEILIGRGDVNRDVVLITNFR